MRWLLFVALLCVVFGSSSVQASPPGHSPPAAVSSGLRPLATRPSLAPSATFSGAAQRVRGWWRSTADARPPVAAASRQRSIHVPMGMMRQAFSRGPGATLLFAVGTPAAALADVIALIGCSVALGGGDPDTMKGWGLAGVVTTTAGLILMQSFAIDADTGGGRPLYGGILLSMALNLPFIAFSTFTLAMGYDRRVAGYIGIFSGAVCTLGPIIVTAASIGPAGIAFLSTSLVGLATFILGFAAFGDWGKVRSRKFLRTIAVAPLFMPTSDGSFASGVAFSGRF